MTKPTLICFVGGLLACSSSFVAVCGAAAAPVVWTGPTISFSKAASANVNLPANQDRLTGNVWLTRGNTAGMFNIAQEVSFSAAQNSPLGTEWATDLLAQNDGLTIAAPNWQQLTFAPWQTAYGGAGSLNTNILAKNAVVHLISDDVYLDLKFTQFVSGSGGAFSYQRSTPVPEPSTVLLVVAAVATFLFGRRKETNR